MIQHFRQSTTIGGDYPVEHFLRGTGEAVLFTQRLLAEHPRAHHRCQGQRHHRRDQNRDCQGNSKFGEQSPDDIAHKQQGDQHRNQREGQRDNGKADFTRAFERRRQRFFAFFDIAGNVFDHHDGVIDHESGGDS